MSDSRKKFSRQKFDDDKDDHRRKKSGGKISHINNRHNDEVEVDYEDLAEDCRLDVDYFSKKWK